jgi:D-alanyl-D-alanine carboxypeptidase (penicillin-binding protein 5/6)
VETGLKYTHLTALVLSALLVASPANLRADAARPEANEAPIALLVDLESGQALLSREADRRFLPASITKVMTAYVAFEMIARGTLTEDQVITVSQEIADEWYAKGSTMFLRAGDAVRVSDLLRGIASVSGNDASIVLATEGAGSVVDWVALMNETAAKLGMHDSHFGTPNGWPDEGQTFVSARDLVKLADAMVTRHPELYARYFGKPGMSYNGFDQRNHDPISGVVPGADGIKTGYTREAGNTFLGSAERDGRRLVMVVAGIEGEEERARISRDFIEWGFAGFDNHPLFEAGHVVGTARVQDGAARSVELRTPFELLASLPRDSAPTIELTLRYRGPVIAPIAEGDRIAELEIAIEGLEPYRIPLEAVESVDKAKPWHRIVNGVLGVFE